MDTWIEQQPRACWSKEQCTNIYECLVHNLTCSDIDVCQGSPVGMWRMEPPPLQQRGKIVAWIKHWIKYVSKSKYWLLPDKFPSALAPPPTRGQQFWAGLNIGGNTWNQIKINNMKPNKKYQPPDNCSAALGPPDTPSQKFTFFHRSSPSPEENWHAPSRSKFKAYDWVMLTSLIPQWYTS